MLALAVSTGTAFGQNTQPSAGGAPAQPDAVELEMWQLASKADQAAWYQEYLRQYPAGRFAFFAQARLAALGATSPQAVPTPVPVPGAPPPVFAVPGVTPPPVPGAPPVAQPATPPVAAAPVDTGIPLVLSVEQTRLAQESLEALGIDPGGHDGVYGGRTAAAVMQYQSILRAVPTGQLTAVQYNTLIGSVTEARRAEIRQAEAAKTKTVYKAKHPKKDPLAYRDAKSNYKAIPGSTGRVGNSGHVCRIRADLCEAGWD
jgi:hypothetical protein